MLRLCTAGFIQAFLFKTLVFISADWDAN
jgi:hypothetical protein